EVLSLALEQCEDIRVLSAHPTSAPEAVQAVLRRQPDVALLDLWMPGMEEQAVTRSLMGWIPKGHVIFLSWFHGADHVARAMRLGAAAFIPKSADVADVAEAIRQAHAQKLPALAEQLENLLETMKEREDANRRICDRIQALTSRELQIVRYLSTGRPVGEIGKQLGITSGTVKAHIRKILLKTQAQSQKQVIAMARFCGAI
ncbi:MAG: LuxR C-terminal-related transcriptional regulator, partial [Actinomycetota bacterium]